MSVPPSSGRAGTGSPIRGRAARRAPALVTVGLVAACGATDPRPPAESIAPIGGSDLGAASSVEWSSPGVGVAPEPPSRPSVPRDPRWATPLEVAGLPNLHRVSATLYRGAQPDAQGFRALRELGVRTIVNLRASYDDAPPIHASGVPAASFQYVEIPMKAWEVDERQIVRFLSVAADPARHPIFVHCQHGADRTGIAIASYRVAVEGWAPADAATEMTEGGFGFHAIWSRLARQVRAFDPARLRRAAGLAVPPPAP